MKRLNDCRMRLMLVGVVAAMVLGGGAAEADFTFGEPTNLGSIVNSSPRDHGLSVSSDSLMLYFNSDRPGGYGYDDIWVTTRPTVIDPWGAPENLGPLVNTSLGDTCPSISTDGLELYFGSYNRPGGYGSDDIWVAKRATRNGPWGVPVNLGTTINTSGPEGAPRLSTDGLELYFSARNRAGGYGGDDIWVTRRATKNDAWEPPINLGAVVNSPASDCYPFLSADGLALFFCENRGRPLRPGGFGNVDMWVTTRASVSEPWGTPVNLGPQVNSPSHDSGPVISPDGFTLYFGSNRPGGFGGSDIWQVPILPVVDFNGDGIVDTDDMCIMVDYWGTDESLCDIGPMPLGDGIVDVQDLIVLAEHLFTYPGAVAYWNLDETEGNIAHDIIGDNDGTINGEPAWQPEGGIVDGALQLDGIDDYVSTEFIMNPAEGPFSMFVWIKGGAPGQVVLSQKGGVSWLCTDASEGHLMTELKGLGRSAAALLSQTVITDGNWHRIGLVWDGSHRTLCVDGVAVAEDIQDGMEGSDSGLYIGAGKAMGSGTFWSGLIDDVRIYSRAVRP